MDEKQAFRKLSEYVEHGFEWRGIVQGSLHDEELSDLEKELGEKATALSNFRFGTSNSKTKNVKAGKNLKKEIAQILTILKEEKKA